MFRENIGYKLVALAVAIIIWYYANSVQQNEPRGLQSNIPVTKQMSVPLRAQNTEEDCVVTGMPRQVMITVEGHRDDVLNAMSDRNDLSAFVDLHGLHSGRHSLPVMLSLPGRFANLVSKRVEPHEVVVELDRKIRRDISIDVEPTGNTSGADSYEVLPSKASVYGSSRDVNAIARLVVFPKSGDFALTHALPVVAEDQSGAKISGLVVTPRRVQVRASAVEGIAKRSVFVSLNTNGQPPFPYKVMNIGLQPQSIVVTGGSDKLKALDMVQTEPIRLSDRRQTFIQRVKVIAPEGVSVPGDGYVTATIWISTAGKADDVHPSLP